MGKTLVEINIQDHSQLVDGRGMFTADWNLPRKFTGFWYTDKEGEEAAEEAFHVLNAPEELLTKEQKQMKNNVYRSPSLSVGDIVRVITNIASYQVEEYLCASVGWLKR